MRRLVVVDEIFEFQDGTVHLSPLVAISVLEGVKVGDKLELRRPDGTAIKTTLYGLDWPSPMRGQIGLSVKLKPLTKADIPVGTEIWKVG